jgi:hypothetical protein
MCKLLRLVFAIWKSDQPFDAKHYDWEHPTHIGTQVQSTTSPALAALHEPSAEDRAAHGKTSNPAPDATAPDGANKKAAGHTQGRCPARKVVTAADSTVDSATATVRPFNVVGSSVRGPEDFATLRKQVTMHQVLTHLNHLARLKGGGAQRRGPCPVHDTDAHTSRSFSVNFEKNVFRCFHPPCAIQGNVLDLWAAVHRLPLRDAAEDLARTFKLETRPQA